MCQWNLGQHRQWSVLAGCLPSNLSLVGCWVYTTPCFLHFKSFAQLMCSCLYFFVVSLFRWNWKCNYWIWCYVSCLIPGRVKWMCIKICYVNAVWIIYSRDSHGFPSFERLNSLCRICRRRPKRCSDSKPTIDLYEAVGKVCVWTYTMDSPCTSQCCHVSYLLCVYGM